MHKALIATALSLLVFPQLTSTASAQQRHRALTAQMLAQVQEARSRQTAAPAQVARHGTLQVTASITKKGKLNLPIRCIADITVIPLSQSTGAVMPSELSQSQPLTFSGNKATCTLSMAYNWPSIDKNSLLFVMLDIATDGTAFYRNGRLSSPVAGVVTVDKDWTLNGHTPVPPANGVTVYDFGDLTL